MKQIFKHFHLFKVSTTTFNFTHVTFWWFLVDGRVSLRCPIFWKKIYCLLTSCQQALSNKLQVPGLLLHNRHIVRPSVSLEAEHYKRGWLSQAVRHGVCSCVQLLSLVGGLCYYYRWCCHCNKKIVKAKTCTTWMWAFNVNKLIRC